MLLDGNFDEFSDLVSEQLQSMKTHHQKSAAQEQPVSVVVDPVDTDVLPYKQVVETQPTETVDTDAEAFND